MNSNTNIIDLKNSLLNLIIKKSFNYSDEPTFKLASGKLSQYYFDCRATTCDPFGQYLIGEIFFNKVCKLNISAIGGLTMGADPISYAVSYTSYLKNSSIKAFVIRKEPKSHGLKKMIEGDVIQGERVVIIDDVITTGGSTIKAINEAKNFGLEIASVVVLIDRQEGGKENIESLGIKVDPVFTKEELKEAYLNKSSKTTNSQKITIFFDGASRGNPGESSAGVVFQDENGSNIKELNKYIGISTNNAAEYKALIFALDEASNLGYKDIEVRSDSELVIKQLKGEYQVKNHDLKLLYSEVMNKLTLFINYSFLHIPRENNKRADKLANIALDQKLKINKVELNSNTDELNLEKKIRKRINLSKVD